MGVYNGGAELRPTLDSVLGQNGVDMEFVVIDDGSTDGTWKLLERRAAADSRLRPLRQQHVGLTKALIEGCKVARGEFIARQDVGDESLPHRLRKQLALLSTDRNLTFVACQFISVGPNGEQLSGPVPLDGGEAIISSLRLATNSGMECPHHGSVMFRRKIYEKVGGYRSEFYFAQDLDLWSRLIEAGDLGFVEEVLYRSSFIPGDISARYRSQQLLLKELIREAALCRRRGETDNHILERARLVRPQSRERNRLNDAAAEYFIGSCLLQRGDRDAGRYLSRAVRGNPLHLKAWAKLLLNSLRNAV
jgi:glycosyltransferase involved in cell wall biosynthesis